MQHMKKHLQQGEHSMKKILLSAAILLLCHLSLQAQEKVVTGGFTVTRIMLDMQNEQNEEGMSDQISREENNCSRKKMPAKEKETDK
jgi:hypothetical protein